MSLAISDARLFNGFLVFFASDFCEWQNGFILYPTMFDFGSTLGSMSWSCSQFTFWIPSFASFTGSGEPLFACQQDFVFLIDKP